MKKLTLLIILLSSFNIISQEKTKIFFPDFVECFYAERAAEPIFIHNSLNGKKIAELSPLNEQYCWYKFAISESKNGWLKIENILVLPACKDSELNKDIEKYKGKWVSIKNMKINLSDSKSINYNFYSKPNSHSKIVFTANKFLKTYLIAVSGTWAKLLVKKDGKEYLGWLERKYQCPYPWTTCPVWE